MVQRWYSKWDNMEDDTDPNEGLEDSPVSTAVDGTLVDAVTAVIGNLQTELHVIVDECNGGTAAGNSIIDNIMNLSGLNPSKRPDILAYDMRAWNCLLWIRWKSDTVAPFSDCGYLVYSSDATKDAKLVSVENKDTCKADMLTQICQLADIRKNSALLAIAFRLLVPELQALFTRVRALILSKQPSGRPNPDGQELEEPVSQVLKSYEAGLEELQSGRHLKSGADQTQLVLEAYRQMAMLYETMGTDQDHYLDKVPLGQKSFAKAEAYFTEWLQRVKEAGRHTGTLSDDVENNNPKAAPQGNVTEKSKLDGNADKSKTISDAVIVDAKRRLAGVLHKMHSKTKMMAAAKLYTELGDVESAHKAALDAKEWNGGEDEASDVAMSRGLSDDAPSHSKEEERQALAETGDGASAKQHPAPSAAEIKAAKAARIRLGLEAPDPNDPVDITPAPTPSNIPSGVEPTSVDVDYTPSEQLEALDNPTEELESMATRLANINKDWLGVTTALLTTRRLTIHHSELLQPHLPTLVPLIRKSCDNARSALCKSGLLCVADLLKTFGDSFIPHMEAGGVSSLLLVLMKKASQDKRFVVDEARKTLLVMVEMWTAEDTLRVMNPHIAHKSPKIRAEAAKIVCAAFEKLHYVGGADSVMEHFAEMLQIAGKLVSDKEPDARKAARTMATTLKACHGSRVEDKSMQTEAWEAACKEKLDPTLAAGIIRASKA